jgi:hypothetical protein
VRGKSKEINLLQKPLNVDYSYRKLVYMINGLRKYHWQNDFKAKTIVFLSLVREIKMMAAKLILSYCHRWNHDNRSNETIGYGCRNNMTNPSSRNASCALTLISTFSLYRYTNDVTCHTNNHALTRMFLLT